MIQWDKVITVDQKQLEKEQQLRAQRDRAIADTDWLVTRHRDELDMLKVAAVLPDGAEPVTTLSGSEYAELLRYRQALRDWPTVAGWADNPMPEKY